ncbi:MAG: hypothetical protein DMF52_11690 [Acidobacteria bacterium]|nr:MAG: hypothetical protein AUI52_03255 [Acidobacteria bacterium 13_1_40CM_2_68_10]OLE66265.1 MAG: hypothetical protein AUG03_00775 [Acidobacteria bacterium 13_1_20CM_2_68_14]PYT34907.1 MAG: hypothetical protein DMF52_11690 [Acidobacteriota bacterium]
MEDQARRLLKITVGVMGSAGGRLSEGAVGMATEMGRVIAARGCVLVTGACPGLPHYAVKGAKAAGGIVVGISPALNFEEHCIKYHSPYEGYDMLVYTGSGLMGREIENIRSCDLVVFMGGRSGTLGEFAIAYDEGKVIGILQGTGGIADRMETIVKLVEKETGAHIIYSRSPADLLDRLIQVYNEKLLPYYKTILANSPPDGRLEE